MRWPFVASIVLLTAGQSVAQQAGALIAGQVVDAATGAPVRKAVVGLWHKMPPPKNDYSQLETDGSGRFMFADLKPGTYVVNASANGFLEVNLGDGPFELADRQQMTGIIIRLVRSSAISGTVVDEDGDPLVRFLIQIYSASYASGRRRLEPTSVPAALTDDRGRYRIAGVAAGKYYLSAGPASPDVRLRNQTKSYVQTFYPNVVDRSAAAPIVITSGQDLENINLKLSRTPIVHVSGQVIDAKQFGAYLIPVTASDLEQGIQAELGADGKFEFKGVLPGDYTIQVVVLSSPEHHLVVRRPIRVGAVDIEGMTIATPPAAWIAGRVSIEGGGQIDWSKLVLHIVPGDVNARITKDRTFRFDDLAPDRYRIAVDAVGFYLKAIRMSGRDLSGQVLELGGPLEIEIVLSPKVASLSGVVHLDGSDQSAAHATVVLIPEERDLREYRSAYRFAETDGSGIFSVSNIPPGEYRVVAWERLDSQLAEYMNPDFADDKEAVIKLGEDDRAMLELTAIPAAK